MSASKVELVRQFIEIKTRDALAKIVLESNDPILVSAIKGNHWFISIQISILATSEYSFLELADIMEWKRERVKR